MTKNGLTANNGIAFGIVHQTLRLDFAIHAIKNYTFMEPRLKEKCFRMASDITFAIMNKQLLSLVNLNLFFGFRNYTSYAISGILAFIIGHKSLML